MTMSDCLRVKFTWAMEFSDKGAKGQSMFQEHLNLPPRNIIVLPEVVQHGDDGKVLLCVALGRHKRPHIVVDGAILFAAAQERLQRDEMK